MPNHLAINSFAQTLLAYLQQSHGVVAKTLPAVTFELLSSGRFSSPSEDIAEPSLTLYLHRITLNQHLRNARTGPAPGPLALDLHFLLTVWSTDPAIELKLMGWALRQLHYHAFLNAGSLAVDDNPAQWAPEDVVTLLPAELTTEEMARIWEAARRGYRLSHPFIARVVRLGLDGPPTGVPVIATQFELSTPLPAVRP
jgi:hypothetical protein